MKAFAILMFFVMIFNASLYSCGRGDSDDRSPPSNDPVPTHPNDNTTPPPVEPDPGPDPDPVPIPPDEPEPEPSLPNFRFNVKFYGSAATPARIAKYKRAICVAGKVIDSEAFKSKILSYDSPYTTGKFYDTSKTNRQIWDHMMDGNETLQPTIDHEMDVEVEFYYKATTTVGYTYGSSKRIWVNTKYFDGYTPASVAANLTHEWLHKLGYKHAVNYSASRDHSVPYAIGSMVRSLGKQYESKCP